MYRGRLNQLLRTAFNEAELRDLCFNLNIDYEELPGRSKLEKIRELIGYCERAGRVPDLIAGCQGIRPHLDWQDAVTAEVPSTEQEKLEQAIAALETQRVTLGDMVVDAALTPLRQQLKVLASPKLPPQNKQVTVLYARQSGFTMMFQSADLEELRDLVNLAWERLDTAVVKQGGLVNSRSGDQMTALFGAVTSHPDDPARAIKAALDMQASLAEMKKERDIPLSIRIGISTGSVLLEQVGAAGEFSIIGDTVKIANILEENGPADGILIADTTYDQVRGVFDVAPAQPVVMRGRAEPVSCYMVRGVKAIAFNIERHAVAGVTSHLIGRDYESGQLKEAYLAATEDNERQMVNITGDSGLGKSRLLDEFFDWIELRPERIRFYKGEAFAETQGTPYALLRQLLLQRLPGLDSASVDEMRQVLEGHLSETLFNDPDAAMKAHFIGQLLGFNFADSRYLQPMANDPKQLQDRATLYLIEYFDLMTRMYPVVIFLENLQWADDSSLDLINRLALALGDTKVLIATTARPEYWERRPHWGEGYEWHTRFDLRPLSPRESRRLLREILLKMVNIPDSLEQRVLNRAAGNPFYIVEIVKMLLRDGVIFEEGEEWRLQAARLERLSVPSTLVGILQAHLDALSDAEQAELRRAAIVGATFWDTMIAYLADGASAKQLQITDQVLSQLHGREIISRRESSRFAMANEYAFRNTMLRQVTQESVPKRARKLYHALAAKWLLQQQNNRVDEYAGNIADHLEASGQKEPALRWLQQAGDQATARFAHAEAISYYSRALAMIPEEDVSTRVDLLLKRESGYHIRGERALQAADLDELERLVTVLEDVALQVRVTLRRNRYAITVSNFPTAVNAAKNSLMLAQRVGATDLVGKSYLAWGSALTWLGEYKQARHCFEQALIQSREARQSKLEADSLRNLGNMDYYGGEYASARVYYKQSLTIYRQIGDRQSEGKSLNNLGIVAAREGNYAGARTYYEQTITIYRLIGDLQGEGVALLNLGIFVDSQRDYGGARAYFEQALTICQKVGDRRVESFLFNNLGIVDNREGNYAAAHTYFEQSLAIAQEIGDQEGLGQSLSNLGEVARFEGDLSQALDYCQQALAIQRKIGDKDGQGYSLTCLGDVLADLGKFEAAAGAYEKAMNLRRELGRQSLVIEDLAGLARVSLAQGALKKASEHVNEILAWLATNGTFGISYPLQVQLTCYRVLKASAEREPALAAHAAEILTQAHTTLMVQAERITDTSLRQKFLENVKANREIIAAWEGQN